MVVLVPNFNLSPHRKDIPSADSMQLSALFDEMFGGIMGNVYLCSGTQRGLELLCQRTFAEE